MAGAPALRAAPSSLPTNEMCPIGYGKSSLPKVVESFTESVFWKMVGFGHFETAINTELMCPM